MFKKLQSHFIDLNRVCLFKVVSFLQKKKKKKSHFSFLLKWIPCWLINTLEVTS